MNNYQKYRGEHQIKLSLREFAQIMEGRPTCITCPVTGGEPCKQASKCQAIIIRWGIAEAPEAESGRLLLIFEKVVVAGERHRKLVRVDGLKQVDSFPMEYQNFPGKIDPDREGICMHGFDHEGQNFLTWQIGETLPETTYQRAKEHIRAAVVAARKARQAEKELAKTWKGKTYIDARQDGFFTGLVVDDTDS